VKSTRRRRINIIVMHPKLVDCSVSGFQRIGEDRSRPSCNPRMACGRQKLEAELIAYDGRTCRLQSVRDGRIAHQAAHRGIPRQALQSVSRAAWQGEESRIV